MQKRVIWLVEDEASIADTLIYSLQTDGFEVEWFPLGQPLLARLEQTRPDFLILDVGLPDISGFELCKQVRGHCDTPGCPYAGRAPCEQPFCHALRVEPVPAVPPIAPA